MSYRQFDTATWKDPWVEKLKPLHKYLFIYLWTNDSINQAGIYEITPEYIAFQTGLTLKQVETILPDLEPKVFWDAKTNVIWVKNFFRNQCQNPSFAQSALDLVQSKFYAHLELFIEHNREIFARFKTVVPPCTHRGNTVPPPSHTEQNREEQNRVFCPDSETESCAEPDDPVLMEIPCSGKEKIFYFRASHKAELEEAFPNVDVLQEVKKSILWQKSKRQVKTARGQMAHLFFWMGNDNDRGKGKGNGNGNVRGSPSTQETLFAEEKTRQRLWETADTWRQQGKDDRKILANIFNDKQNEFEAWRQSHDRT